MYPHTCIQIPVLTGIYMHMYKLHLPQHRAGNSPASLQPLNHHLCPSCYDWAVSAEPNITKLKTE